MLRYSLHAATFVLLIGSICAAPLSGQTPPPASGGSLTQTVSALDTALFDAYNTCDLEKFKTFFTDDVEFYHDQGGVTVGVAKLAEQLKANICGIVRRELVAASVQVYPMKGFGALQTGVHRFHQAKIDPVNAVGEAKFIHLWRNVDGVWKITRVISYDHVALKK